jgi:hypothetical protein
LELGSSLQCFSGSLVLLSLLLQDYPKFYVMFTT